MITGFVPREAIAELKDDMLVPTGQVKFGLAGKERWRQPERLRAAVIYHDKVDDTPQKTRHRKLMRKSAGIPRYSRDTPAPSRAPLLQPLR